VWFDRKEKSINNWPGTIFSLPSLFSFLLLSVLLFSWPSLSGTAFKLPLPESVSLSPVLPPGAPVGAPGRPGSMCACVSDQMIYNERGGKYIHMVGEANQFWNTKYDLTGKSINQEKEKVSTFSRRAFLYVLVHFDLWKGVALNLKTLDTKDTSWALWCKTHDPCSCAAHFCAFEINAYAISFSKMTRNFFIILSELHSNSCHLFDLLLLLETVV